MLMYEMSEKKHAKAILKHALAPLAPSHRGPLRRSGRLAEDSMVIRGNVTGPSCKGSGGMSSHVGCMSSKPGRAFESSIINLAKPL